GTPMNQTYRAFIILSFMFAANAQLFAQKTATVLPKGVWRVRMVNVLANPLTQSINSNGEAENLLSALEKRLTPQDLAASSADLATLYNALNSFEEGLGDSLFAVDLMP